MFLAVVTDQPPSSTWILNILMGADLFTEQTLGWIYSFGPLVFVKCQSSRGHVVPYTIALKAVLFMSDIVLDDQQYLE
jgi:hypothetical protein